MYQFVLIFLMIVFGFSAPISPVFGKKMTRKMPLVTADQKMAASEEDAGKGAASINLHISPNKKSKILATFHSGQQLVPIYRQGDWEKVGNPENGLVGWVNITEYRKMMYDLFHPVFESVVSKTMLQNGRSDVLGHSSIVAYRDGKKLSKEESEQMYKKMQMQQEKIQQQLHKAQKELAKIFTDSFSDMPSFQFPVVQPVIFVLPASKSLEPSSQKVKSKKLTELPLAKGEKEEAKGNKGKMIH